MPPPTRRRMLVRRVVPAALVTAAMLAAGATPLGAQGPRLNSENNPRLGPAADHGKWLGHPTNTYMWHGCTQHARFNTNEVREPGMPPYGRGNRQAAVTFTRHQTGPYVRWQTRPGWRICGVQMSVLLGSPDDRTRYASSIAYRSAHLKGQTAPKGRETVKVRVPRNDPDRESARRMAGKVYTPVKIYDVTVFVKRIAR